MTDPRFGGELRRARLAAGLSLRQLARTVHYSAGHLSDLEHRRRQPTPELAAILDQALAAAGTLTALVHPTDPIPPGRPDPATVDTLAAMLAAQRHLEDAVGSAAVLPAVRAQLATITTLVRDARGRVRAGLVDVAAQWAQYAGWLHIAGHDRAGQHRWLTTALELATEVDNRDLAATVMSFRGYAAEQWGHAGPMVDLTRASLADDGVYIGQRAYDWHQLARGLAYLGDQRGAVDALHRGHDLAAETAEWTGEVPPWHYYRTPAFFALEEGRGYAILARSDRRYADRAVELLTAGLPAGHAWVGPYARLLEGVRT